MTEFISLPYFKTILKIKKVGGDIGQGSYTKLILLQSVTLVINPCHHILNRCHIFMSKDKGSGVSSPAEFEKFPQKNAVVCNSEESYFISPYLVIQKMCVKFSQPYSKKSVVPNCQFAITTTLQHMQLGTG